MQKKIKVLFIVIILGLSYVSQAQQTYSIKSKKAISKYTEAINAYRKNQIDMALAYIDEAIEKEEQFVEAYLLQADIFNYVEQHHDEVEAYLKVESIDPDFFPYMLYNLGLAYWNIGEYENAHAKLKRFLQKENIKARSLIKAQKLLEKCDFAMAAKQNPVAFNPQNLGDSINTASDQYWPSLSLNGETMVYTVMEIDSTQKNMYGEFALTEDFYVSYNHNGAWSRGEKIPPPLNTDRNEGAQKLSADGKVIVYTACNRSDGYGMCDIYFSFLGENGWGKAVNAGPLINTRYSEKQPALSPDNRRLYFSSNRPEGKGGMDLWVSEMDANGTWKKPKNLGDLINTSKDDIAPFIFADNASLYYSSEGHMGLGKQDIFYSKRQESGEWGKPTNIGYPINTYRDEFGLVIDLSGTKAYYASNINAESTNIYTFDLPKEAQPTAVSYIKGKIYDAKTKEPLKAVFQLLNVRAGDTVMYSTSDYNGRYLTCLPIGKRYAFNVSLKGYLFYSHHFNLDSLDNEEPYIKDIPLHKIEVGQRLVLQNIFFNSDEFTLTKASSIEVAKLRELIEQNPEIHFEIGGHTDNSASKEYNDQLSLKRAKAVYDALNLPNDLRQKISFKGYGQHEPIAPNNTEQGKAMNRRTELKIIE